ncbi:MAG: class I SAM-dependent methyltransferase [Salinisphaera sp.]|nr:class I SAM-dependent methyltransferase [Salinisphaera sp.]
MLCRWVAACDRQFDCDLLFDGGRLPIASGSLDAVVLPHSLEQAASPYRLLREVDRVLCHRGQLLIQGFNPWSPWAQRQRLRRPGLRYPARRLVPFGRIVDWLSLLDYDVNQARRYAWGFPWASRAGLDLANAGWRGLPALLAPAYVVLARKRVMPVTPAWAPRRRRVHGQVAEPSARMSAAARKAA